MQTFSSLRYTMRVLLAVSANFPDNPRTCIKSIMIKCVLKLFFTDVDIIANGPIEKEAYGFMM